MTVTAKRTLKWLTVLVCTVSMTPTVGVGQDRTSTRARDSNRSGLAPLVNIFTEQQSRTRLEDGDVIAVFEGQVLTLPLPDSDAEQDLDLDQSLPAQRLLALARDLEPGQTVEIRYLRDGANNSVSVEVDEFEYPEVRTFGQGLGRIWGVGPDGNRWNFGLDEDFELEMAERMRHLEEVRGAMPGAYTFSFGVTFVEGAEFVDLNPELGEYFGSDTGVLVVEVDEDSTLGLMAGDVRSRKQAYNYFSSAPSVIPILGSGRLPYVPAGVCVGLAPRADVHPR